MPFPISAYQMKFLPTLFALAAVTLSSCSTKFTEAERQTLSTVSIARTTTAGDAYNKPYGGSAGARQAAGQAGVNANAGAIGGAVGALIGEAIAAVQDSNFQRGNGPAIATVEKNTPRDVDKMFNEVMTDGLKKDAFFGSRITQTSPNVFTSSVTSYGLNRNDLASMHQDQIRFSPHVSVKIELTTAAGKKIVAGYAHGDATAHHSISEYAQYPGALRQDFKEAASVAQQNFLKEMARRTAK